jgi:type I restriction enzyme R subunit
MSHHAYTEDQLVEQPAIGLFAALGWQTVSATDDTFGVGGTLGRETKAEVVLTERLRAALTTLNPGLPAEAIETAIDELTRDRSAMSLEAANREIYRGRGARRPRCVLTKRGPDPPSRQTRPPFPDR